MQNRTRAADAVCARANSGFLNIYAGTPPTTAENALSSNPLLATLTMAASAFGGAVNGVATAAAIGSATATAAAGGGTTATFFRVMETGTSPGTVVVFQGSVGTSGSDLNLSSTNIIQNGTVSVSSLTYTQSAS
jgi:hypothetical protein